MGVVMMMSTDKNVPEAPAVRPEDLITRPAGKI